MERGLNDAFLGPPLIYCSYNICVQFSDICQKIYMSWHCHCFKDTVHPLKPLRVILTTLMMGLWSPSTGMCSMGENQVRVYFLCAPVVFNLVQFFLLGKRLNVKPV